MIIAAIATVTRRRRQRARGVSARPLPVPRSRGDLHLLYVRPALPDRRRGAAALSPSAPAPPRRVAARCRAPRGGFGIPITISSCARSCAPCPAELEDAAAIDGCTAFGFFWRILLPLTRPALMTVTILSVITSWNNFILPLLVLTEPDHWTLPLGAANYSTEHSTDTAGVLAFTTLSMSRRSSSSSSPSVASSAASPAPSKAR